MTKSEFNSFPIGQLLRCNVKGYVYRKINADQFQYVTDANDGLILTVPDDRYTSIEPMG
jgi:hypothetical protein